MFRVLIVVVVSLFFSGAALAHDDDRGYRHHHRHHHHRHHYDNFGYGYGAYLPPAAGYYPVPRQYYGFPPVRSFSYQQQLPMPRYDRHDRGGW